MYIAINWLVGMVLIMWVLLCCLDVYWKKSMETQFEYDKQIKPVFYKNSSLINDSMKMKDKINISNNNPCSNIYFQLFMCFAGVCTVLIVNRKDDIITFTKRKFSYTNFDIVDAFLRINFMRLKRPAIEINDAILKIIKNIYSRLKITKRPDVNFNIILLNKLKELNQERSLSDILIAPIKENKNRRMHCQVKTICNCENITYNVHLQKTTMENLTINLGLQQLYLLTQRENMFLKSRLKTITREKNDAERKLIQLINRVCQTKNTDLKAYCNQFIVQTKNNLLNSDVKAEIQKFLQMSPDICIPVNIFFSEQSIPRTNYFKETEAVDSGSSNVLKIKTSKFKLSETQVQNYFWTVKDKDGIIEKLYECDNDFQNGDMIKRIRQYSVYYDRERFIDLSNSSMTSINLQTAEVSTLFSANQRFLTGSQIFKNFLQNNKSIAMERSTTPNSTICIAT